MKSKKVIRLICVISIVIALLLIIAFILNSPFLDVLSFITPLRISIGAILIPDIISGRRNKE